MKAVTVIIEATFEVADDDVKALKKATPENQLATARMLSGRVKSTVTVARGHKS